MTSRDQMVRAFQVGFDEWQRRYDLDPSNTAPIDQRGAYFAALLDELAAGRSWQALGDSARANS